jgi:hypothetical protein
MAAAKVLHVLMPGTASGSKNRGFRKSFELVDE